MIARISVLVAALSTVALAAGKLEIFHVPARGVETAITGVFEMPSAPVGGSSTAVFRLRNTGDAAVNLTSIGCPERWCSMTGQPLVMPYVVAPGLNVDFTIRFSPPDAGSYTATVRYNSSTLILRGSGVPAVALYNGAQAIQPGGAVDFGALERGQSRAVTLQFRNPATLAAKIENVAISGSAFRWVSGAPAGQLAPGATLDFSISFNPTVSGTFREKLTVDGREFLLTGTANEPPLSRPSLRVDVPATGSAQQGRLSVHLSEPSKARATKGTLTLTLQPSGSGTDSDASLAFQNGSRTMEFTVNEGDSVVKFGSEESVVWQSGTTAGTIVFSVEVGGYRASTSLTIGPERVRFDKAQALRTASGIDVRLQGFDNTRSVTTMNFTFYLRNGQPMAGMPLAVPVGADFAKWWPQSKLGGAFAFRAVFPVSGDASQITAVQVEVPNTSGTTRTERLSF